MSSFKKKAIVILCITSELISCSPEHREFGLITSGDIVENEFFLGTLDGDALLVHSRQLL